MGFLGFTNAYARARLRIARAEEDEVCVTIPNGL